ncbi:maleate cis-trans isomerase family protein [Streptomyces beihaiensis]|uniref:Decarboxylase n=1 Tax=Streptomyces beihaiensis TaxID=2984495 RepID=A0ABT3U5C9_9ACTN|nr:decarboxylase [Streptomyces beihaiensis]MCX3063388.1 decarboxylase [Streptomyces beihaiensis]
MSDTATARVGFLYPGHSAEDDYPRLERMLGGGARLTLVHTDIGTDAHRVDELLEMGATHRLKAALGELLREEQDAIVWACTSASFIYGPQGARRQVEELAQAAGLPAGRVSSTSFAFAHATRALGVRRLAIAATYPDDVAGYFVRFLEHHGSQVVQVSGQGIITAAEVGTLGRAQVLDLARSNDHPDAEAVLLPDTALHSAAWLDDLEEAVGKPVLTANQVTAWEGLRLAGDTAPRDGLGTLFRSSFRTSDPTTPAAP